MEPQDSWKRRIALEDGEILQHESTREKGHQGQGETHTYTIIDQYGNTTGRVKLTEHTSPKAPFRVSYHLTQNKGEKLILDLRWSD